MTIVHNHDSEREMRLNKILLAYVEAVQEGRAPDRRQLLSRYPEFARELKDFLALRDQIDRLAAPLREVALAEAAVVECELPKSEIRNPKSEISELGRIGDFRLIREISRGGMGIVYEAHQTSLNRRVALKVLSLVATLD